MNTPRLRRGEGIASSSNLYFYVYWYSYIVYFVCDSASEFGAMGSTSFLGGFPDLAYFLFSELVIFRNLYNIFPASVGTFSGSFLLFLFFCALFWVSL